MKKDNRHIPKLKVWKLYKQTLVEWKNNYQVYFKIILIVALPVAVLGIFQNDGALGDYGITTAIVIAIAFAFAFIAVINFAINKPKFQNTKLATIYTSTGSRALQYIAVSLVLALLALQIFLSLLGMFASLPASDLLPVIFLPLSVGSFMLSSYLLARFGLAQIIAVVNTKSTFESLKNSSLLTRKNRWRIYLGTLLLLLVFMLVLTSVQFLLSLNQSVAQNQYISALVITIEAAVFVPIFLIFQSKMYRDLNE